MSKKDKGDRVAMLREQANARKIAKSLGREMLEEDDSDAAEPDSDEDDFFKKASGERDFGVEDEEKPLVATKN